MPEEMVTAKARRAFKNFINRYWQKYWDPKQGLFLHPLAPTDEASTAKGKEVARPGLRASRASKASSASKVATAATTAKAPKATTKGKGKAVETAPIPGPSDSTTEVRKSKY